MLTISVGEAPGRRGGADPSASHRRYANFQPHYRFGLGIGSRWSLLSHWHVMNGTQQLWNRFRLQFQTNNTYPSPDEAPSGWSAMRFRQRPKLVLLTVGGGQRSVSSSPSKRSKQQLWMRDFRLSKISAWTHSYDSLQEGGPTFFFHDASGCHDSHRLRRRQHARSRSPRQRHPDSDAKPNPFAEPDAYPGSFTIADSDTDAHPDFPVGQPPHLHDARQPRLCHLHRQDPR